MAMMGLCHFTRVGCLHQETGYLRVEHPLHYYAQRGQRYVNVECRFDSSFASMKSVAWRKWSNPAVCVLGRWRRTMLFVRIIRKDCVNIISASFVDICEVIVAIFALTVALTNCTYLL